MTIKNARWHKQYRVDRAAGITRTVPADAARAHVQALLADGASVRGVAAAAGVSASMISRLHRGQNTVRRALEVTILAVTLDDVRRRADRDGFVPKVGAVRRIQGLLALGWRHEDIDRVLRGRGVGTHTHLVLHQDGYWISGGTHDAVVAAYAELGTRWGPSLRTRTRAERLGYCVPAAWDDDAIDDPDARPYGADDVDSVIRRSGRPGVDLDEWVFLVRGGEDPTRAAERLGVSLDAVTMAARRRGRQDVARIAGAIAKAGQERRRQVAS